MDALGVPPFMETSISSSDKQIFQTLQSSAPKRLGQKSATDLSAHVARASAALEIYTSITGNM